MKLEYWHLEEHGKLCRGYATYMIGLLCLVGVGYYVGTHPAISIPTFALVGVYCTWVCQQGAKRMGMELILILALAATLLAGVVPAEAAPNAPLTKNEAWATRDEVDERLTEDFLYDSRKKEEAYLLKWRERICASKRVRATVVFNERVRDHNYLIKDYRRMLEKRGFTPEAITKQIGKEVLLCPEK